MLLFITANMWLLEQIKSFNHPQSQRIYDFITREPQCFSRECREGHVTGSALVLNHDHSKALLTYHKKLNRWLQLGGHSDGNPNTAEVALREAQEESGIQNLEFVTKKIIDVDVHLIPQSKTEAQHHHYDIRFFLRAPKGSEIKKSSESKDLKWFSAHDILNLKTDESTLRLVHMWQEDYPTLSKSLEHSQASL